MPYFFKANLSLCCLSFALLTLTTTTSAEDVGGVPLIGSVAGDVTSGEVLLYLEKYAEDTGRKVEDLSGQTVANAILDLYGLQLLDAEAEQEKVYSDQLTEWMPGYLFMIQRVMRYTDMQVARAMEATDWESEAFEYYHANPDKFLGAETVSLKTLLLRTNKRSVDEALTIVEGLIADFQVGDDFGTLVEQYSEDEVGRASGGLMEDMQRGQTVEPFERAAFALEQPGQLSPPVISEFGVHLIQLIEKKPPVKRSFAEASSEIIAYLKNVRKAQYRDAIKAEARTREGEGFYIDEEAIDLFMRSLGHEAKGLPVVRSRN